MGLSVIINQLFPLLGAVAPFLLCPFFMCSFWGFLLSLKVMFLPEVVLDARKRAVA